MRLDHFRQLLVAVQYHFVTLQECFLAFSHFPLGCHQLLDGCRHHRQLVVDAVLSLSFASRRGGSLEAGRGLLRALASLQHTRSDFRRRLLHPSCPRLASRHDLPLRTPSALRPRISGGASGDSGRRALSSDTFPASNTTSPYSNNIVLSVFIHN
jgi:hypothetical protein